MEEMTIWEQYTITLNKDPKVGFGIAISGGRDKPNSETGDTAVVISDVVRNGPAAGRLHTRDQIVMVNGVSMENVTSSFTIQSLKSCGKTANVTVKRPRKIQMPVSSRSQTSRSASQSNLLEDSQSGRRPTRRASDSSSERSYREPRRRTRSYSPDQNGHALPLMSGFKRLPAQDGPAPPIKATLLKKKNSDEYGLKLGSQIFIKHMTNTGLAAKEGTLQEGDLVLKINGMTTENLSLLETKHLVERSKGKLTMTVLRDDRKFLVTIPEVLDSAPNSEEDGDRGNTSSELEDISDLESELPASRDRLSRSETRERRTRRSRVEAAPIPKDSPPLRSTLTRPPAHSVPPRRAPSNSESDRSPSPPRRRDTPDMKEPMNKYRVLPSMAMPNPRASPLDPRSYSSTSSRPRKEVSESESDRSASPPRRRSSPRPDEHKRYRVLPDLDPTAVSLRHRSPARPPPADDSESEGSWDPPHRQGHAASQDSRIQYRKLNEESSPPPAVQSPRWMAPATDLSLNQHTESESEASYASVPKRESADHWTTREASAERVSPVKQSSPIVLKHTPPGLRSSPARPPPEDSSGSERAPSPPRRYESTEHESSHSIPVNGRHSLRSNPPLYSKSEEEPLYSLPPDSPVSSRLPFGYSSDVKKVEFVKERSLGLRLVGGNDVGIFVGGVQTDSPADHAGMKEGDQIMQVNGVDFGHFTREEAARFLLNLESGEPVVILAQSKMDIYRKIMQSSLGDSFYIRTHFDHEAEGNNALSFTRGEVFRVVDTMHRGKMENWQAIRIGNDLHEQDKGIIPNLHRAEKLLSIEQAQRGNASERQSSAPRAEFWKLRGLRGGKKNVRKSREDLLQLTIQGKYPAYERVLLREASFKRPVVIMGPLNDVAMEKLSREMPDQFEVAEMVPRSGGEGSSSVIKLDTVKHISEQDKHPLLDITPTAVERLNYIQYHPLVLFLEPQSRKDVKTMRKLHCPNSKKSSRRLYSHAMRIKKYYSHLFSDRIDLQPNSNVWYEVLKERVRQQQSKPVWVSEITLEGGEEEELDVLSRARSTDYLSCDSRATSDYEDTDGEAYTDAELYTDNEDLADRSYDAQEPNPHARYTGVSLARSSEPAAPDVDTPGMYELDADPAEARPLPPILHVPKPVRPAPTPPQHSSAQPEPPPSPSDAPPDFRAPDPNLSPAPPQTEDVLESSPAPLSAIEEKLQQTRAAEPQRKSSPSYVVLAHHQALQYRRTQIKGSDSSDNNNNDEEDSDMEWGPATEL